MKRFYFKYILALLFFGSNGIVANYISLSSYEIVLLRSLFGSTLLVALFFFAGNKITIGNYKKDAIYIALSGIAMAADWLFLFEAYLKIGVSLGMLINYTGPVIIVALSPFLFQEHISIQKLFSLLAAIAGVFLISGKAVTNGVSLWGLLCAILSAFSYSAMVICNKKAKKIVGIENSTLQLFCTFITVAVFVGCKQGFYIQIAGNNWLPVLWLGLLNTGICCYLYFSSINHLPVQTVAIIGYLEPLLAVILAAVILHESMNLLQILGAVLIIGGAILGEFKRK